MKPDKPIKIIKRNERYRQSVEAGSQAANSESLSRGPRETGGQVAAWVKEFQHRRRPDARAAFASLFVQTAVSS